MTWPISWGEINDHLKNHPGGGGVTSWNDLTDKPFDENRILYETLADNETVTFSRHNDTNMVTCNLSGSLEVGTTLWQYFGAKELYLRINDEFDTWAIEYDIEINGIPLKMTQSEGYSYSVSCWWGDNEDVEIRVGRNGEFFVNSLAFEGTTWTVSMHIYANKITSLDAKFLPKAAAVADVTEAPTADDFNALLTSLRNAGYLET